ncbi:unnamed protein product [Heligmosomoides polygyrus]|uniref:Ig-like domain-containing protein n=1 Tax=Heligmosomoides polygyrus TaxID=6339 RepID=A0A183GNF4_HELPZ|nr:unnamed protein product [Heligmosomoides polygyrus]
MTSSLFYGDNNLQQAVIETFYACYLVTETFGDDHTNTLLVLGLPYKTALKPRPMSLDLQLDPLVSCTAQKSTLLRYSASTNSHERPVNLSSPNEQFPVAPRGGTDIATFISQDADFGFACRLTGKHGKDPELKDLPEDIVAFPTGRSSRLQFGMRSLHVSRST